MGFIFREELQKVWRRHAIWMFMLFLVCGYACYLMGEIYGKTGEGQYSYRAYGQLVSSINIDRLQDEMERLEKQREDFSGVEMYTGNFRSEDALYEEVLKQMRHVAGYEKNIEELAGNAEKGNIALFQKNEYTRREQEKAVRDFRKLHSLPVSFASYRGVHLLARLDFSDVILVVFLVLLVAALIVVEKEEQTLILLRSTLYGRKSVGAVKYWCGAMLLFAGIFGIYALKTILILSTYGIGDWNGTIQSVYYYGICRYEFTVGSFLIFTAIGRLAAYMALYSIMFFFAIFIRKAVLLYCSCGILMGLEGLFVVMISEHSWLNMFSKINIISFLGSGDVFGKYQNLNLFQRPVDYAYTVIIIEVCCFVMFMILGILGFERGVESGVGFLLGIRKRIGLQKNVYGGNSWGFSECVTDMHKNRVKSWHLPNTIFLFCKECKKIWFGEKGILLFMIGIIALFFLYNPIKENFQDKDEFYYLNYMLKVEGRYSEQKLSWLHQEREDIQKIQEKLDEDAGYTDVQRDIMAKKAERYQGLERAISNVEYVKENGWSHILYEKGYLILFGSYEGKWELLKLRIVAMLLMVGFSASVWGIEAWSNMEKVLQISARGGRFLRRLKDFHIFLLSAVVFSITFLPWVYNVMHTYGCRFWDAPMGCLIEYEKFYVSAIPIGGAIIGFGLLHFLYFFLAGRLVCIIRNKMGTYFLTVVVSFVLFSLPIFMLGM